jgi:hypothetical protein
MSIPDRAALLAVALQYLETELLPSLQGEHRFKSRVAINALRIVQREIGSDSLGSVRRLEVSSQAIDSLPISDEQLAHRIRDGEISLNDAALKARLKSSLEAALAINNPKWLKRK